ncbi:MAG: type IV toxin-antitoxin system AbiEi family antitoxin domain-containing protein [Ilumatobacteraceae bacterium]
MPACTILGAVGELAASRHGAFTRSQAAEHGLDRAALTRLRQRGVLLEPAPDVLLIRGAPHTWQQRAYTSTLAAGGHGIVIGGIASRLHGLDGFDDHHHVLAAIPRGGRMPLPNVAATQLRASYDDELDVTVVDHIPCSSIARTLVDLARYHPDRYERAADDFQRRGLSVQWLAQTIERVPPRRGDGRAMMLDDLERRLTGGTVRGSWFEQLVERCVASPRIPPVVRQYSVRARDGQFVARPDLAIPSLRIAIEAHSRRHHTGPRAEAFDERRDNSLAEHGWHTSYVGWSDTATPASVCRSIERFVAQRAVDLGVDLAALLAP